MALLILWASAGPSPAAATTPQPPEPAPLRAGEDLRVLRAAEVSLLRDPGGSLGIAEVASPALAGRFQPVTDGLRLGYTQDVVWVRVALRRAADAPPRWRLELTAPLLNDVRFFTPLPGGGYLAAQAGDRHPFSERQVPYRRPAFDLVLPDDQLQLAYLRLETDSTFTLQPYLWQLPAFEAAMQRDMMWIGSLVGVVLLSVFFFVQGWLMNRDRLMLAAAGVTLAFALAAAANLGLLSQYLFPDHPSLADGAHPPLMALFFLLLFALFGRALDFRALHPRLHRIQVLASALCVAGALTKLTGHYGTLGGRLMMAGMLLGLTWITLAAWLAWRARRRGLITAVALSVFTGSFALAPLIALGWLPATRYFELTWVIGSVGFLLLAQMTALEQVRSARSQRREAERALRATRREAEQEAQWRHQQALYFAGVAHDLRTPLTAVNIGLANLARKLGPVPAPEQQGLERLRASVRRLSEMIDRHLQVQRLEQPDFALEVSPARPADLLDQVRAVVADAWPDDRVRFSPGEAAAQEIEVDVELIVRALTNLLVNAVKVSPPGLPVEVRVVAGEQGAVGFEVRDQGPGLGPLTLDALCEVHWRRPVRALPAGRRGPEGFGIGLPLTHQIALKHGGRLEYRREGGATTVFALWLPRAQGLRHAA